MLKVSWLVFLAVLFSGSVWAQELPLLNETRHAFRGFLTRDYQVPVSSEPMELLVTSPDSISIHGWDEAFIRIHYSNPDTQHALSYDGGSFLEIEAGPELPQQAFSVPRGLLSGVREPGMEIFIPRYLLKSLKIQVRSKLYLSNLGSYGTSSPLSLQIEVLSRSADIRMLDMNVLGGVRIHGPEESSARFFVSNLTGSFQVEMSAAELELHQIKASDIDIRLGLGNIFLNECHGVCSLVVRYGDIEAQDWAGPLYAEIRSGNLSLYDSLGDSLIRVESGEIEIMGHENANIMVEGSSANLVAELGGNARLGPVEFPSDSPACPAALRSF